MAAAAAANQAKVIIPNLLRKYYYLFYFLVFIEKQELDLNIYHDAISSFPQSKENYALCASPPMTYAILRFFFKL